MSLLNKKNFFLKVTSAQEFILSSSRLRDSFSPLSLMSDPLTSPTGPTVSDTEDSVSLSSASALNTSKFNIPDTWRPTIMACLTAGDDEDRRANY